MHVEFQRPFITEHLNNINFIRDSKYVLTAGYTALDRADRDDCEHVSAITHLNRTPIFLEFETGAIPIPKRHLVDYKSALCLLVTGLALVMNVILI